MSIRYKDIYTTDFLKQFGFLSKAVGELSIPDNSCVIDIDAVLRICSLRTELSVEPHVQGGIDRHTIYVNPLDRLETIRFRKAHGLGHYILGHIGDGGPYRAENEKDADSFAGRFLAPDMLIARFLRSYIRKNNAGGLAGDADSLLRAAGKAFVMPEPVIRSRMKDMGILVPST